MDYPYNNLASFPTSTAEELEAYQSILASMPVNEEASGVTLANGWGMAEPGAMVSTQAGFMAAATHESVAPATPYQNRVLSALYQNQVPATSDQNQVSAIPYQNQVGDYTNQVYASQYWREPLVQSQFARPSNAYPSNAYGTPGASFVSSLATGAPPMLPPSSSTVQPYWGETENVHSSGMLYPNVHTSQLRTCPTRSRMSHTGRYQPYGEFRTRGIECVNAKTGPSTLAPRHVPHLGLLTRQPSGGIPGTTADATNDQQTTEEKKAPHSEKTRVPYGQGKPRFHRIDLRSIELRVVAWAQRKAGSEGTQTVTSALGVAVLEVQNTRKVKNQEPCLKKTPLKESAAPSRRAMEEREKRLANRGLYEELSRYYSLGRNQKGWSRRQLLAVVMEDLEESESSDDPSSSSS